MPFIRSVLFDAQEISKKLKTFQEVQFTDILTSTVPGLKVIRSYHVENICLSEFFSLLDDNTRANYLIVATSRWAAIRFDWVTIFFIAMMTSMAMLVRHVYQRFSTAQIALALSQLKSYGIFAMDCNVLSDTIH